MALFTELARHSRVLLAYAADTSRLCTSKACRNGALEQVVDVTFAASSICRNSLCCMLQNSNLRG